MRDLFILPIVGALLLSSGATLAQVIEPDRAPHPAADTRHPALPEFSMQQRAAIYRSAIAAMQGRRAAALPVDTQVEVGGKLPATVELYPLPDDLLTEIAGASKYKYTVWNDQVLLVDPANMVVTDILHDYILRDYEKKQ
jgi:hypothetical protein